MHEPTNQFNAALYREMVKGLPSYEIYNLIRKVFSYQRIIFSFPSVIRTRELLDMSDLKIFNGFVISLQRMVHIVYINFWGPLPFKMF